MHALLNLINQMNNCSNEKNNENNQNMLDSKYRNIECFKKLCNPFKTKSISLFYLNICFLQKKFDNLQILLNELNINLDIIAITESSIKENVPCPINIQLPNYSMVHAPTETLVGGALLYINSRLSYKPRAHLKIYTPTKLESIFIEIICPNTSNLIIGCIYKHPVLHIDKFNSNYISPFVTQTFKESSKQISRKYL